MFHNKKYLFLTSMIALFILGFYTSYVKPDQVAEEKVQTSEVPALYILRDSNNKCGGEMPPPANQKFSVSEVNEALDTLLMRASDDDSIILYVHGRAGGEIKEAHKSLRSVMPCIENENNAKVLMFYWPGAGNGGALGFPEKEARQAGKELGEVVSGFQEYKEQNKAQFDNKKTVLLLHSMGNIVFEEFIDKHQPETLKNNLFDTVILSSSATKTKRHASWLSKAGISNSIYVMVNKHDPVLDKLGVRYAKGRLGKKLETAIAGDVTLSENAIYVNLDDAGINGHRYFTNSGQEGNENVAKFFDTVLAGHPVDLDNFPGVRRESRDGTFVYYFQNENGSANAVSQKVYKVTAIQLNTLESLPLQLKINAEGNVRTGGWSNPQLTPYEYIAPPADGIYEFDFKAQPPSEIVTQVITPIKTSYTMDPLPDNLKGVKIYTEKNNMVAMLEAKDLISDIDQANCSDVEYCGEIGKLNCGAEVDGPLYYFNVQSEEIISACGGACFGPDEEQQVVCETLCPPPSWDCDN